MGTTAGATDAALGRRSFLRGTLAGVAGMAVGAPLGGCADTPTPRADAGPGQPSTVGAMVTPDVRAATPGTPRAAAATVTAAASPVGGAAGSPARTATATVGASESPVAATPARGRVLLAYFSRAGESYAYGGRTQLAVGNTEVLAGMIARLIGCDVHRIEAAESYSDDYEETVARNVREQDADARPAVADPPASLDGYDTVLLGSPIWNVHPPMLMATFAGRYDFSGKTVFPFVTYAVSGLGTAARDYAAWCPGATIGAGLAVRGEEVSAGVAATEAWLRRVGLLGN